MESRSVMQSDYTAKLGERAQAIARAKSEFLLGNDGPWALGAFQSVSQHDYVEHAGPERAHEVRPPGELQVSREGTYAVYLLLGTVYIECLVFGVRHF